MAVVNVSTMHEFISACHMAVSDTTINIMADLDFNEVVSEITGVIAINDSSDVIRDVIINGNNHAIYNIEGSDMNPAVFHIKNIQNFELKDLSFLNCHITKSTTSLIAPTGSTSNAEINNCVVQGMFWGYIIGNTIHVNDTMFTLSGKGNLGSSTATYNRCWIKLDGVRCNASTSGFWRNLNSCYIEGDFGANSESSNTVFFNGISNSCINLDMHFAVTPTSLNVRFPNNTEYINIINSDKLQFIDTPLPSTTKNILVTDEQMKNAEYLAGIGFDIVP